MNIKRIKELSKIENNIKMIKVGNEFINVIKYLPSEKKMLFVYDVLGRSIISGRVNPVAVDISVYVNIVMNYSDVEINLGEDNIFEAYDILVQTGMLDKILEAIPKAEIDLMFEYVKDAIETELAYLHSASAAISDIAKTIADSAIGMLKENPEMLNVNEVLSESREGVGIPAPVEKEKEIVSLVE